MCVHPPIAPPLPLLTPTPAPAPAPAPAPSPAPAPLPKPAPAAPRIQSPAPAAPDIAIERAERRKNEAAKKQAQNDAERERNREATEKKQLADKKKLDAERKQAEVEKSNRDQREVEKREAEARETKADEARAARLRENNLSRMMGQAATATGRDGAAARDAAPSAAYAGRLAKLIRDQSVFVGTVAGNPATEVEVTAAPSGTIIGRRVVKSSGSAPWDDAVLQAIDKTGRLPADGDGRVPPRITIVFRPNDR